MNDITCDKAKALIEKGAQLVDVRSSAEFQQGSLPGARNIPLEIFQGACNQIDREKPVILYCVTGRRSSMAKSFLESLGYSTVYNLGSFRNYYNC